mgnify:FL=1
MSISRAGLLSSHEGKTTQLRLGASIPWVGTLSLALVQLRSPTFASLTRSKMRFFPLPLPFALLVPLASCTLFITSPTASSSLAAGKSISLTWLADPVRVPPLSEPVPPPADLPSRQDTTQPKAAAFGAVSLGLYTGSSTQQTLLQNLGNVSDPVRTNKLAVKIDPRVGPDSSY